MNSHDLSVPTKALPITTSGTPRAALQYGSELVIRRDDFLAALESPDVQATLARAHAIIDSDRFPPRDASSLRL